VVFGSIQHITPECRAEWSVGVFSTLLQNVEQSGLWEYSAHYSLCVGGGGCNFYGESLTDESMYMSRPSGD
jgi:hypothetical protein